MLVSDLTDGLHVGRIPAKAAGNKRYIGLPCRLGHVVRYVVNSKCVSCKVEENGVRRRAKRCPLPLEKPAVDVSVSTPRADALAAGLVKYVGRPCVDGHTVRYVSNMLCVECSCRKHKETYDARKNDPEFMSRIRQASVAWKKANLDKVREQRRKRRRLRPNGKVSRVRQRMKERRRRARKKGAEGSHTLAEVQALFFQQRGRCAYCRTSIKGGWDEDHIVALVNGGSDWIRNIQLLCKPCNNRKGAKDPIVFAQGLGRLL